MKVALRLRDAEHVEMFDCFGEMVRGFVQLLALGDPANIDELDERINAGAVVRMTFTIGSAGPLGMAVHRIGLDGSAIELLAIDAPPRHTPFQFKLEQSDHCR